MTNSDVGEDIVNALETLLDDATAAERRGAQITVFAKGMRVAEIRFDEHGKAYNVPLCPPDGRSVS